MIWKNFVADIFFPRRCPLCDKPVKREDGLICRTCEPSLKLVESPFCMKCGKPLYAEDEYCSDCEERAHEFIRGRALFVYGNAAKGIYRFKYGNRQEYADYYGKRMAQQFGNWIANIRPDGIIPIPLSRERLAKRGYNQAELLAEVLSRYVGVPVYADYVVRIKNTVPQKELNVRQRQNNLKKAFKIVSNDVKLKTIILIDDIYTTGSTMDALSKALKEAGTEQIYFLTLAVGNMV